MAGVQLLWRNKGINLLSRARDPAHRRLGPRGGCALVWASNNSAASSAHPLSHRTRTGQVQFFEGAVEYQHDSDVVLGISVTGFWLLPVSGSQVTS